MAFTFQKAERRKSRLRMALSGPSGSGKTYGALAIAKGLGGKIAVVDTERGSASLYTHLADFDVLELAPPFSPERYIEAIRAAEKAGYDVLILDSITHEWNGEGGVLEIVDNAAKTSKSGSSFQAWKDGGARHRKFVDAMLNAGIHVIATMRAKAQYVQQQKRDGHGTEIRKVGTAPEQRDGIEFEFTAVLDLNNDGNMASASKDRTGLFADPLLITEETGKRLYAWLEAGLEPGAHGTPEWSAANKRLRAIAAEAGKAAGYSRDQLGERMKDLLKGSSTERTAQELHALADTLEANPAAINPDDGTGTETPFAETKE